MNGLLTESNCGDLVVDGGGWMIAATEAQIIEHVLVANRGELREFPLLGGEVRKMQHGLAGRMWTSRARRMINAAGVDVSRVWSDMDGIIKVE